MLPFSNYSQMSLTPVYIKLCSTEYKPPPPKKIKALNNHWLGIFFILSRMYLIDCVLLVVSHLEKCMCSGSYG